MLQKDVLFGFPARYSMTHHTPQLAASSIIVVEMLEERSGVEQEVIRWPLQAVLGSHVKQFPTRGSPDPAPSAAHLNSGMDTAA